MHPAEPYLDALGRSIGLPLELSPTGSVALQTEGGGLLIQWAEDPARLILYAELGILGSYRQPSILSRLLSANFLMHNGRGVALSISTSTDVVGINTAVFMDGLTPEAFLKEADVFLRYADAWRQTLGKMKAEAEVRADRQDVNGLPSERGDLFAGKVGMLRV